MITINNIFKDVYQTNYFCLFSGIPIKDNLTNKDRLVLCASEIGGTAILVFLGCMGCVSNFYANQVIPHEQISWTFGLAVMVTIQVIIIFYQ